MSDAGSRLAVLGSPISHSKSPAIQRAAYGVLGLDWTYEAIEMTGDGLGDFVAGLDDQWRGLSLTMPLKRDVLALLAWRHPLVDLVGGANTVLLSAEGPRGFNTDVQGAVESFASVGVSSLGYVHLLGAGATAASVLVAVAFWVVVPLTAFDSYALCGVYDEEVYPPMDGRPNFAPVDITLYPR